MVIGIKDTRLYAHPETPERRAALTWYLRAATGLDEAVLEAFLRAFYGAARQDPLLGAAFAGVADWEAHIARWLTLFEETAAAHLPPVGVAHLTERARRIAASLEMGLTPLSLPNRTSKGVPA